MTRHDSHGSPSLRPTTFNLALETLADKIGCPELEVRTKSSVLGIPRFFRSSRTAINSWGISMSFLRPLFESPSPIRFHCGLRAMLFGWTTSPSTSRDASERFTCFHWRLPISKIFIPVVMVIKAISLSGYCMSSSMALVWLIVRWCCSLRAIGSNLTWATGLGPLKQRSLWAWEMIAKNTFLMCFTVCGEYSQLREDATIRRTCSTVISHRRTSSRYGQSETDLRRALATFLGLKMRFTVSGLSKCFRMAW